MIEALKNYEFNYFNMIMQKAKPNLKTHSRRHIGVWWSSVLMETKELSENHRPWMSDQFPATCLRR